MQGNMAKSINMTDCWFKVQIVIRVLIVFCLSVPLSMLIPHKVFAALEPHEVLVIANSSASDSVKLAKYYMTKRGIPSSNLIKLRVTDKESCSRVDYDLQVVFPVVRWLKKHKEKNGKMIRCLVMLYGMPLRVLPTPMSQEEKKRYAELLEEKKQTKESLKAVPKGKEKYQLLERRLKQIGKERGSVGHHSELAALDSELALLAAGNYSLARWQLNPSYLGYRGRKIKDQPDKAYMVARLDGPNPDTVKRIIDDSIQAEKNGLKGTAYLDARWPRPDRESSKKLQGYKFYDNSLYLAADKINQSGTMTAVINDQTTLFQPGECPDAALYSGWYRRANYLDAFDWQPGAVGYHIASSECGTLKSEKSRGWCLGMLRDGAAAVIGPIGEPYIQAFPPPALFFSLLIDGRYSLAESFAFSVPFRSWRMVLVGDPLYRPFKNSNKLH
jgi:uncharacterized protein (TIGR03790 family)